jgi:hypothetical protein
MLLRNLASLILFHAKEGAIHYTLRLLRPTLLRLGHTAPIMIQVQRAF